MADYPTYTGKKFRATGEKVDCGIDEYTLERKYKDKFVMTKGYKTYLLKKQLAQAEMDCRVLKHKLEMQQAEYGEVDPIDLGEYQNKLNETYRLIAKLTK